MAKELSMTKLDRIIKSKSIEKTSTILYNIDGDTFEIEVKHTIPMTEMIELVNSIVDNLFVAGGNGELVYTPARFDLALAANLLKRYTNLKGELGEARLVAIVYGSSIMDDIKTKIGVRQLNDIEKYVCQLRDSILASIRSAQEAKLNDMAAKLDLAIEAMNSMTNTFASVDQETMQSVIENLSRIEPSQLVKAVSENTAEPKADNIIPIQSK